MEEDQLLCTWKTNLISYLRSFICPIYLVLPAESSTFKKRLKREYRKTVDRLVRSHAFHKLAVKMVYLIGFIISVILGALLYFDK